MSQTLHFEGWTRTAAETVVRFLSRESEHDLLDLSDTLIIVPTRQAGRHLRERLVQSLAEQERVLLGASIITPAVLIQPPSHTPPLAGQADILQAWTAVLQDIEPAAFPDIFASGRLHTEPADLYKLSASLQELRRNLSEGLLTAADAADTLTTEPGRWDDLRRLEQLYLKQLKQSGLTDPEIAKIEHARQPELPEHIRRILLAALPEPSPLLVHLLSSLDSSISVDIITTAPPEMAEHFDIWGRPLPSYWTEHPEALSIPYVDQRVFTLPNPRAQAEHTVHLLKQQSAAETQQTAIGMPDPEVSPYLLRNLHSAGIEAYDPAEKQLATFRPADLILRCCRFARESSFASLAEVLRHPDLLQSLQRSDGIQPAALIEELDRFYNGHLPQSTEHLLRQFTTDKYTGPDRDSYEQLVLLQPWVLQLNKQTAQQYEFIPQLRRLLADVYGDYTVAATDKDIMEQGAAALNAVLDELSSPGLEQLSVNHQASLLEHLIRHKPYAVSGQRNQWSLEGWLELPWLTADTLIITGVNEGVIPDSVVSDPWLPDSARRSLGLRDDLQRLSRDIFLLRSLMEARKERGQVFLLCGAANITGDPLLPSRLLFRGSDEAMLATARRVFNIEPDLRQAHGYASHLTFYVPEVKKPASKLPVTALRDYLACPFRFYLKHLRHMETVNDEALEMDPRDFGTLLHESLARFGSDQAVKDSTDPKTIIGYLHEQLRMLTADRYGDNPALPVHIAHASARARLEAFAYQQVLLRGEGWEIIHAESALTHDLGITLSAKVDRIDYLAGTYRIIDYKTGDTAIEPEKDHLRSVRESDPDWQLLNDKKCWNNLQLPAYVYLAAETDLCRQAVPCYFNLPKALSSTALKVWDSYAEPLHKSACECLHSALDQIQRGRYWPPAEQVRYDDFEDLFGERMSELVDDASAAHLRGDAT